MENIVANSLIVKLVKDISKKKISEETGENLMLKMEKELKDFLFRNGSLDERYKFYIKKKYLHWIETDSIYHDSIRKYVVGKVKPEMIDSLPYYVAVLLVKYIKEKL